jgi:hypothetical protein
LCFNNGTPTIRFRCVLDIGPDGRKGTQSLACSTEWLPLGRSSHEARCTTPSAGATTSVRKASNRRAWLAVPRRSQFLPQPSILPQCDLLITHGGNNTLCEGFHFGLPMIGLPLFWDQYDNAQRLQGTGYGARLPTYDWTQDQLLETVDRLTRDDDLAARMRANATEIQARNGRALGAALLIRVAGGG